MNLIGETYFVNDIAIPDSNNSNLASDITRYEREILDRLLGYELRLLVDAYDVDESDERIVDLVDGKTYTVEYNGRDQTIRWEGLRKAATLTSLIAYYVYFKWQQNNATKTTNLGDVSELSENAIRASAAQTMGAAWHNLRELYGYSAQNILVPSAYNFLYEHRDDYEDWVFDKLKSVNMFGI